ncbi:MAG TPA: BatD family protein, partial [Steroidobacteraceae bacterium]
LQLPKREIYVGESIPVEIQVGMRDGFVTSLNGLPTLNGDEFTLNNLSRRPQKGGKLIGGQRFTVLTWRSILGAVKPGAFSLSAASPLTVRIRTRPRRESQLDDLLGDPFLQNFYGATVAKDITVSSPQATFTVLALPTQGRPPDFRGAVGTFKISSDLSAITVAAGDPLTLRMHVRGTGNFDRVDSTMLGHVDQWKTYQPKATFNSTDPIGYRGEKIFEQPLIAARPGRQTLPGLAFSYFDPDTHRYETARSSPLRLTISPSAANAAANRSTLPPGLAVSVRDYSSGALRPDHIATGAFVTSLVPIYLQPRFRTIAYTLALVFAGGWLGLRRSRGANYRLTARERASARAVKLVLRQMNAAAGVGDPVLFFKAARAALQRHLAASWNVAPDRITATDIEARLGASGADISHLFSLTDEASYSGLKLTAIDFQRWTELVRQQLIGNASH